MSKEFRITTRRGHYRVEERHSNGSHEWWEPSASSSFNGGQALHAAKERKAELERQQEPWEVVE